MPPLAPVPHLRRLMTPGEELIYTVSFYPLRGWIWLVAAVVFMAASYFHYASLVGALLCVARWWLPLATNEVAITNHRLMLRTGVYKLLLEDIEGLQVIDWKMEQGPVGNLLNYGSIRLRVRDTMVREILLEYVRHPLTFVETIERLQLEGSRRAAE